MSLPSLETTLAPGHEIRPEMRTRADRVLMARVLEASDDELLEMLRDACADNPALSVSIQPVAPPDMSFQITDDLERSEWLGVLRGVERTVAELIMESLDEAGFCTLGHDEIAALAGIHRTEIGRILVKLRGHIHPGFGANGCVDWVTTQVDAAPDVPLLVRQFSGALAQGSGDPADPSWSAAVVWIRQHLDARPPWRQTRSPDPIMPPDLVIDFTRSGVTISAPGRARMTIQLADGFEDPVLRTRARALVDAVNRRWAILVAVGWCIVRTQRAYLTGELPAPLPLTRRQVAAELGCHESTISRTVADRVVRLPNGSVAEIASLFDRSAAAKSELVRLIDSLPRPLSDRVLAGLMTQHGYPTARRTIAKYRAELNLPSSRPSDLDADRRRMRRIASQLSVARSLQSP